ncbi:ribosome assembly RNA-binding protein YhbY [Lysobacter sp. SG-8]|uniref:Ribosome assembly RNA-binding protein YhbY n=1 Tax=Marilutibacter penaei TaxID=2759900 RepID=A0A7W3YFN8_9GAMM|nr:ribosome assembly RNA-binding protein YhbY [Lysobacter penaei]MBB1089565.1 ribosome assembly RNA-binding protein YhbY [Lysobacter penaei]
MPTPLTAAQTRFLRGQAHDLKAMLQVGGKGITDAVVAEVANALEHHELIKVKVAAEDREQRAEMIDTLAERTGAALVQKIGHTAVLYRQSSEKRQIVLPRP